MVGLIPLLDDIRQCRLCAEHLPLGPRPVVQASESSRLLIAAQAPGRRVHETGLPFNDPSGDRLRAWLNVDRDLFYDSTQVAIVPMGFCFPGTGRSGDLPPRPECADTWRTTLLAKLVNVELTLVIGQYAQAWHLPGKPRTLTDTVMEWRRWAPSAMPLPHPSPRNNIWLRRNPWFETDLIPELQARVAGLVG